jgi:hypothetical protein
MHLYSKYTEKSESCILWDVIVSIVTRLGLYKHYFPVGIFQENEKEILQVLGQETTREILMLIIERQAPIQTAHTVI